jgi:ethanolamine ammonia-lyase small subunit
MIHSEFKDRQGYITRPCLKNKIKQQQQKKKQKQGKTKKKKVVKTDNLAKFLS